MAIVAEQNTNIAKEVQRAQTLSFFYFPTIFNSPFGGTTMSDITTAVKGALEDIAEDDGLQTRHLGDGIVTMDKLNQEVIDKLLLKTYDFSGLPGGTPLETSGSNIVPSGNAIIFDISEVTTKTGWVKIGMYMFHASGSGGQLEIMFWDNPTANLSPTTSNAMPVGEFYVLPSTDLQTTIDVYANAGKVYFTIDGVSTDRASYTLRLFAH